MIRPLIFLFLGFVVIWDLVNSGPDDAALTRASVNAYRWAKEQVDRHDLIERTRRMAVEAARAVADGVAVQSGSATPHVANVPPVEPILVQTLADAVSRSEYMAPAGAEHSAFAIPAATAPTAATLIGALAPDAPPDPAVVTIGDSVFAKDAILAFIAEASGRTGVSAGYLEALALRESSFNPVAASDHSTARGLYQFIESTWLEVFARHGVEHGQDELAALIAIGADGRPSVSISRMRGRILDLRFDPKLSTFLAAQLARDNRTALEADLGRPVSDSELYIAHFLGVAGARTLIETNASSPRASAADLFPWAARSNRRYFYDGRREKTVAELYDALLLQAGSLEPGDAIAALPTADS